MASEKFKLSLWAAGFVAFALLFQAAAGPLYFKPESFEPLSWRESAACAVAPDSASGECFSEPFHFKGDALAVWVKGVVSAAGGQGVVLRRADTLSPIRPIYLSPGEIVDGPYSRFRLTAPELNEGGTFVLQIFNQTPQGKITARNRAEVETSVGLTALLPAASTFPGRLFICILGAVLLMQALRSSQLERLPLWVVCAAAALVLFYRPALYYYWDEWYVLQRFSSIGIAKVLEPHNEHFLPLFFLFYYAAVNLFASAYWLMLILSALVHGANCLLLYHFLNRISSLMRLNGSRAPRYLTLLFGISALHPEVLQWAFELSVLLSFGCSMALLLSAMRYLKTGQTLLLPAVFVLSAACPLTFGNGFAVFGLVALLALLLRSERLDTPNARIFGMLAVSALGFGLAAALYKLYAPQGAGTAALNLTTIKAVLCYVWVGTQLGTVLRGLGLFPALELEAAQAVVPLRLTARAAAEIWVACAGFAVSLAILTAGIRLRGPSALKLWLFGSLISASALALPALGRVQLGIFQSLSLRYQYLSLVGLTVMLLPLADAVLNSQKTVLKERLLILFLTLQLFTVCRFDYFSVNGMTTQAFVKTVEDWEHLPKELRGSCCAPEMPPTVTPVQTAADIAQTLRWLRGEQPR